MTNPTEKNRLAAEPSPYLQQHADNPVNWQPWDDRAFETAAEHDVPVFVSIGYSACHWCHVMEEESFANETVAGVLNESFVPIKIDREERPDVDAVFMTICQLVTGGGGWPLSAWCTPDGDPFYIGTYFPKRSTRGRSGFLNLCEQIAESWNDPDQRAEMENRAEQWLRAARDQVESVPDQPGEAPGSEILKEAAAAAVRGYDTEYGGFGSDGPKFPLPGRIELLLQAYAESSRDAVGRAATGTLDAMASGGMYDHVGGGFHRYATDRSWTIPHFEKMLYDNAELPRVYLQAYRLTGDPRYARIARETFRFIRRELTHETGVFFSTLDARSVPPRSRRSTANGSADAKREGSFYTWRPSEVEAVLEEPLASLVCDRYGITTGGNFERGTTVLTESTSIEALSERTGLDRSDVRDQLLDARETLYDAREDRPRPARDEKVLAGWNGRTISAFAAGARTLDPALAAVATDALSTLREMLWDDEATRLDRRWIDSDVKGPGYLEDYAYLARGAFDLYQTTGDLTALAFTLELSDGIVARFYDESVGTIYSTPVDATDLSVRPQELMDRSTPSSIGVAVDLLLDLDGFAPDRAYREIVETVLETHADRIRANPLEHVSLVRVADRFARGGGELVFAGGDYPDPWWEPLSTRYLPGTIRAPRPASDTVLEERCAELGLSEIPPIWAGREAKDGAPTVYACRGYACSPPHTTIEPALEWISSESATDDGSEME